MELHAPGADMVGFEYAPTGKDDHDAIDAALAVLSKPSDLFVLPADAECIVVSSIAELEGEQEHNEEHDDEHADEHNDEHHDDHKDEDHSDHSDHEESEGEEHTEFHAEYVFECKDLSAVTEIDFPYVDIFPNAKELELQAISQKGASAFEIERDEPSVKLGGLF
jgi:ABC-type Zn2+ transport system substrate-binding protein/surface adhesin